MNEFLESRPPGTSPRTSDFYNLCLGRFITTPLNPSSIERWLTSLPCHNTKVNYYRVVGVFVRWLWKRGYITENPVAKVDCPKVTKKLLPAITTEQSETLLSKSVCDRDRAVIQLLFSSGMRLSEAARVKSSDFDWIGGTVTVLGKGSKYRKCLFEGDYVTTWFKENSSFALGVEGIKTMLKRLGNSTGMTCNPHAFRRGFCTSLLRKGLSTRVVQSLGGWEDLEMVERYSKSLTFDDALAVYRGGNGHS